jgi:hypothetical protein
MQLFEWSCDCRNNLLHAERYPPSLGGLDNTLYLTKKIKKSRKSSYIRLTLEEVRFVADNIRAGIMQCVEFRLYLVHRTTPISKVPERYRPFAESLPKKLVVPPFLNLTLSP